jgi:hypothetical protein
MNRTGFIFKGTIAASFILALGTMCFGQSFWKKDYGPGFISQMFPESEGNFCFTGQSGASAMMITVNLDGDTVSTITYGETTSVFTSVLPTPDCFLICAGQRDNKGRLIKMLTSGDTMWTKSFTDSNSSFSTTMFTTANCNFLFAGTANGKAWLIRIQTDGTILWEKTYGKSPSAFTSIYETTEGDFLISGNTQNKAWVIKINEEGDTLWTKSYADSTSGFQSVLSTSDDCFLLPGYSKGKGWLVKIKPNGDTVWTKTYGSGISSFNCALGTSDGNYLIAGDVSVQSQTRPLLVKIKPNGDTLWTKTYSDNAQTKLLVSANNAVFFLSGITAGTTVQSCWIMSIIDDQYAYKNKPFTFTIPAASPNSDSYVYTAIKAPAGMTITADGTISWGPTTDSVSIERVEYLRKWSTGQKDTLTFNIFVNSPEKAPIKSSHAHEIDAKGFNIAATSSSNAIKIFLPAGGSSVCIYDITGKIIDRIAPTLSSAGPYALYYGTTSSGGKIPSGKYFAKVTYGNNSRVKPFLFVR